MDGLCEVVTGAVDGLGEVVTGTVDGLGEVVTGASSRCVSEEHPSESTSKGRTSFVVYFLFNGA